jgi:hypothetical protein
MSISGSSIEWDVPPSADLMEAEAQGPGKKASKDKKREPDVLRKKFRGVAHRALPDFAFITPENLAEVEKFFDEHGGKWRKVESREIFVHSSRVIGSAIAKGDALEFELSADPRGVFGEKNVMAVNVRGGTVDNAERANAKIAKLEKDRLTDKLVFEKMEKQLLEDRSASQAALEKLQNKIQSLEAEIEACKHYAVKVGFLEREMVSMKESLAAQVTQSVRAGMASLVEDCHRRIFEDARAKGDLEHSVYAEKFEDPLSENGDSEDSTDRPARSKRVKTKRKQRGKMITHNQGSSVFGILRSSFGLGLLMMLLIIFGHIAMFSARIPGCEALSVKMDGRDRDVSIESVKLFERNVAESTDYVGDGSKSFEDVFHENEGAGKIDRHLKCDDSVICSCLKLANVHVYYDVSKLDVFLIHIDDGIDRGVVDRNFVSKKLDKTFRREESQGYGKKEQKMKKKERERESRHMRGRKDEKVTEKQGGKTLRKLED